MKRLLIIVIALIMFAACKRQRDKPTVVHGFANSTLDAVAIRLDGKLPEKGAVQTLFDQMDYQQAVQCYLWALPMVSLEAFKETQEKVFGATSNDLVVYKTYEDKLGILTANATTPYILSFIDLAKTGPMVIEMPAGHTAGGITDCWQREVISIGEMGADKGKGGKYVLVPPGKKGFKARGYYAITCPTMNLWFGFRALDPDPQKTDALISGVKIYPYYKHGTPPKTRVLTPAGKKYFSGPPNGMAYWETLNNILQDEPVAERDRLFAAWLENLGIRKGHYFYPNERQKNILIAAADRGRLMAMANSFSKRFSNVLHWPDRRWDYVMIISDPSQRAPNYDEFFERTSYFYEAVGYSKSMITKTPNVGQAYLGCYVDKKGKWLNGGSNYTLHVPANPPAVNFWSLTVYDSDTRCLIDNAQRNADLSSREDLIKNSDGSVDLYFGPKAPQGKEKNWVQTVRRKQWFAYMRFYGPTTAYFDKSWKMGDIEGVK